MSDLPRLLFCCFDVVPGPSAVSRRLSEYLKGLSERFQVVVLSVKTAEHPHIERYHGARLLRVPVGSGDLGARVQAFDRAVRRQLESEEYRLVHFFDPWGGQALTEKHDELGYRLVYDAGSFPSLDLAAGGSDAGRLMARVRRQELSCLMNADAVVVGSTLTRDWVGTVGVERPRVHVLPSPIELGPYAEALPGLAAGQTLRAVHLGSLAPQHAPGLLFEALALARSSAAVSLLVIGSPEAEALARLTAQLELAGLGGAVELRPAVPQDALAGALAQADVALLTLADGERTRLVGSPLARLGDYLAAGLPVIAADLPAARALVPDEAALWYRPGDPTSLALALVDLAGDPARRVRLGQAARAAAQGWDAALVRADLVALYAGLLGEAVPRLDSAGEGVDANEVTQLGGQPAEAAGHGGRRFTSSGSGEGGDTSKVRLPHPEEPVSSKVGTDPVVVPPEVEPEVLEIADDEVETVEAPEDEVLEADESIQGVEADTSPPASAIDPWLAQVVHGYCPPGSDLFDRPVPPTTMPGRDG